MDKLKALYKRLPHLVTIFVVLIYGFSPNEYTVFGLFAGVILMAFDATVYVIVYLKEDTSAKRSKEVDDKIIDLAKQIDSIKTAIAMRQLGR